VMGCSGSPTEWSSSHPVPPANGFSDSEVGRSTRRVMAIFTMVNVQSGMCLDDPVG